MVVIKTQWPVVGNHSRNYVYKSALDINLKALDYLNIIELGSQLAAQSVINRSIIRDY